jgi:uncharacterized membrane protein YjgN (DUF898 family)
MSPFNQKLTFKGHGSELLGIWIVNFLLTVITLGLYYPWAKVRSLKFFFGNTELAGSSFSFTGNGTEIFMGFIKALLIIIAAYVIYFLMFFMNMPILGGLILLVVFVFLIPVAIHGTLRYRLSRTAWRGIHMGYRGEIDSIIKLYIQGSLFTILTLGIYSPWFIIDIRKYIIDRVKFGNVSFEYNGSGTEYFVLNLISGFLTIITLGIYSFWWQKKLYNYYIENLKAYQDGNEIQFASEMTAWKVFKFTVLNSLLIMITLGIATPWVMVNQMKYIMHNATFSENFNPDAIVQTEEDYNNTTGEGLFGWLDLNIIF